MTKAERKLRTMRYCGFVPTDAQLPFILSPARFRQVAGGERGGKSRVLAEDLLHDALDETRRKGGLALIWLISREYEGSRKEFTYMVDDLRRLGILVDLSFPAYGPCTALGRWNGAAIQVRTRSGKDARKVMMEAPHYVGICEAGKVPYETYMALHGRVSEHRGKIAMSGTFWEPWGWYPELYTEWQIPKAEGVSFSVPTWSNLYKFPGGRDDPEVKRLEGVYGEVPGLFDARCGGVPTPPVGLVFREFSHLVHVRDTPYRPGVPVYLGVDPSRGTNPYAVVVCQVRMGDEVSVIDEIYEKGKICEEIIKVAKAREWWGDVKGGAIGHDAPDDRERWGRLGGVWLASKNIKEEHLIRRIQTFLLLETSGDTVMEGTRPRFTIDPHCKNGIKEFTKWRRGDNNKPIDKDNHWLKALGYWLINKFGFVEEMGRPKRTSYTQPKYTALAQRSLYR